MAKVAKVVTAIVSVVVFLVLGYFVAVSIFAPSFYFSSRRDVVLEFPSYGEEELSGVQRALVDLARETLGEKPESFYENVPLNEPWCANYVSYLYKEIGLSFVNPVTGGWRIPGIYTLRDYLTINGYWRGLDYRPVVGDIAIYDKGLFGGHTNLVLKVDGDKMITIGGNEDNEVKIREFNYRDPTYGLVGFGHIIDSD